MNTPDTATEPVATNAAEVSDTDILKMAMEADAAVETSPSELEPKAPTPEKTAAKNGEPAAPAAAEQPAKANEPAKPEAAKPEAQTPKSEYAKKQAELERRDRSWRALDEEKQKFRAEENALRGELDTLKRELQALKTQRPAESAGPAKDDHGNTVDDYTALARRYRQEGRDDMAEAALERADKLRRQPAEPAAKAEPPPGSPEAFARPEFQQEWQKNVQALVQAEPDLANPQNPVVTATNRLLADPTYGRFFKTAPDGIRAAVEVAKLMRVAEAGRTATEELGKAREELKTLRAEKARLDSLLQPQGSRPAGPAPMARTGADASDAEMLAMAAAADRGEI